MKRLGLVTMIGCSVAGTAVGAAAPEAPKFGFDYHWGIISDDDGLSDETAAGSSSTTKIQQIDAALRLEGKASDKVSYHARYHLNLEEGQLEYAYAQLDLTNKLNVKTGINKVNTYGWDQRDGSLLSTYGAVGFGTAPADYRTMLELQFNMMGEISLQIFDDNYVRADGLQYKKADANGEAVRKNPGYAFSYIGKFGKIQPMLQYLSYDLNHSTAVTVGVKFETKMLMVAADYVTHSMKYKESLAKGAKELEDVITRIQLSGEFNLGMVTPWIHYSSFDNEQHTASGVKQPETNSALNVWDDNASRWGIGAYYNRFGQAYRPYLAIENNSGKFISEKTAGKEVELSKMVTTLGVVGVW